MRWVRDYTPQPEKNSLFRQALILTLVGNVILAAGKGLAAYFSGSVALYSDAANSVSDVLYSVLMIGALWLSQRPPDLSHPQGHSRFEPLAGLLVTFSMAIAGYEAGRTSIERFIEGGQAVDPGLPTLALILSAAIKLGMFFYIRRLAVKVYSPTLKTVATDNLNDVFTSTAAFIGAIGSTFIHPLLDAIGGILVAGWIFRSAFQAGSEHLSYLTGASASEETRRKIVEIAEAVPGVLRVHHLMAEFSGPRIVVDIHVNVSGETELIDTHRIEDEVMAQILQLPEIDRVYVHIEPDEWEG